MPTIAKSNNQTESVDVKLAGTRRKRALLPGEVLLTTNSKKSAEAVVAGEYTVKGRILSV